MAPSPSADGRLQAEEATLLLDLAEDAIVNGLRRRPTDAPDLDALPPVLREPLGAFVTLTVDGQLNGCIGSIQGDEPLGHAVGRLARGAAFSDWRLPPLRAGDYPSLTIEVSLLSPLEPIPATSRQAVLDHVQPRLHGLVIAADRHRGIFLPAVWDKVLEPEAFLHHLQLKAGMSPRTWPDAMEAWRFTVEKLSRRAGQRSTPWRAA